MVSKLLIGSLFLTTVQAVYAQEEYADAVNKLDFKQVKEDLVDLLSDSQDWWPADYGNYGPFFVRLAWHCSGSYRHSDGRGGCSGGRQRFEPEQSWDDNTNLDKARKLLWPIKQKHGLGLSWGDLFILAGTTAIEHMGGPILGFCGGRPDDNDGSESQELGPTPIQELLDPCEEQGACKSPLGSTVVGLIYLDPQGNISTGTPDYNQTAIDVYDSFGRMSMNRTETVALIGGGHSFGKTHGACKTGPGPSPEEDPANPWPGTCGEGVNKGKGANAFTSGFEGPWTEDPVHWDNTYFSNLLNHVWEPQVYDGGKFQWKTKNESPTAPAPSDHKQKQDIMMLTSDISLLHDDEFLKIVKQFAADEAAFNHSFMHAWYKLTTRDVGPYSKCVGPFVPEPQPFQFPLPKFSGDPAKEDEVKDMIKSTLTKNTTEPSDDGSYGALLIHLAWQCASTFRSTDSQGGCNGARIRFSPEKDFDENKGMDSLLQNVLEPIKSHFGKQLSWADLIVLAGDVAIEEASGHPLSFCARRTDAMDGTGSMYLKKRKFIDPLIELRERIKMSGLTGREMVALAARPRSAVQQKRMGYEGSWTNHTSTLSNEYFNVLLNNQWTQVTTPSNLTSYKAVSKEDVFMMPSDLAITWDPELKAVAQEFASDNDLFLNEFTSAWSKLMNIDRFDGPLNLCTVEPVEPVQPEKENSIDWVVVAVSVSITVAAVAVLAGIYCFVKNRRQVTLQQPLLA